MDAEVTVSVDFGTTFSGFAYAHRNNPKDVYVFEEWPGYVEAGGNTRYCKTQTSLFYLSTGQYGSLELKAWGWPALQEYMKSPNQTYQPTVSSPTQYPGSCSGEVISILDSNINVGYYITKFKLFLSPGHPDPILPLGLTVERLITDYLKALSDFAMDQLKVCYGRFLNKSKVKWCLTVPAIWDEAAKEVMEICAEKAGMVKGANCFQSDASPYPLAIVLEPEAASMYAQKQLHHLKAGDKFLVADIGGGTIDLALHQKVDNDSLQVRELEMNRGVVGGGIFVDFNFMHLVWSTKLNFLNDYSKKDPKVALEVWNWWLPRKCTFDGSPSITMLWDLPRKLSRAWKEHDESLGITRRGDDYDAMTLNSFELCNIFDPEVSKVVELIREHISSTNVKCILLVGGFSQSRYLLNSIRRTFDDMEIVVPPYPGSAVIHGAVRLGCQAHLVVSRVCKRTYGIKACLPYRPQDPSRMTYDGRTYCNERFSRIIKKNQSIPSDFSASLVVNAVSDSQTEMTIALYSSENVDPQYVTEVGCVKGGTYCMNISDGMSLGRRRQVEVTMYFGKGKVEVSAKRINFGNRTPEKLYSVKLEATSHREVGESSAPPTLDSSRSMWRFLSRGRTHSY